ncbi:hypothetical protein GCM10010349_52170 [Streptomyces flavofungini]|uniref:hypothetical protein n=1 Tax=Streptomyces flavofungini TaxID=68200 RepID=UPI0019990DE6|nr:hypothetical protein [Streptomyces flavofungini]GHC74110.1 hypothetical protein GCM10010349_52170 [Streptomyces flavofungini]
MAHRVVTVRARGRPARADCQCPVEDSEGTYGRGGEQPQTASKGSKSGKGSKRDSGKRDKSSKSDKSDASDKGVDHAQ